MHLSRSIDIQAPPDVVWNIWSDVERWSDWTASISRIDRLESGPFVVGSRARVRQPKLPTAIWRVTDLQPGVGFTWVSTSPGAHVTGRHYVEPHAGGSRATMSITFEGALARLFGRLTRSLTERYLQLEANGLKARSESQVMSRV